MTLTASATSLRHWITDQINEIRHLTPLAVLGTTGAVTALDYLLAPGLDTVPGCQWEHLDHHPCPQPATIRVTLHACPGAHIGPLVLLCDHHTVRLIATWTAWFARTNRLVCADCDTPFRAILDVIKQVSTL